MPPALQQSSASQSNPKFMAGDNLPNGWNWRGDWVVDARGNVVGRSGEVPQQAWFMEQQQQPNMLTKASKASADVW